MDKPEQPSDSPNNKKCRLRKQQSVFKPQLTHNSYLTHLGLPYLTPVAVLIQATPPQLDYIWTIHGLKDLQENHRQKSEEQRLEGSIQ
jgi:hypothetical protein